MSNRSYSPDFKLQVVLEALQFDGTDAEVSRTYYIHPVTLSNRKKLKEDGAKTFGGAVQLKDREEKIANLEQMVGPRGT